MKRNKENGKSKRFFIYGPSTIFKDIIGAFEKCEIKTKTFMYAYHFIMERTAERKKFFSNYLNNVNI